MRALCDPETFSSAVSRHVAVPNGMDRPEYLVLFGDPGTLVRRSQWEGPVDQLDEPLARHEREWVTGLVRYLQGEGERPAAFQLHEGLRL